MEAEEGGNEGQAPKRIRDPGQPTKAEREEHEVTHIPFTRWCRVCVRARGRDRPHRKVCPEDARSAVPRIVMDYGYLHSDETGAGRKTLKMLIAKEMEFESLWAYQVDNKGAKEGWLTEQVCKDLDTIGRG